jgi:hypothetical protein
LTIPGLGTISPGVEHVNPPVDTAYQLFNHLIDLGQYDLAAKVMVMQIEKEDRDDSDA